MCFPVRPKASEFCGVRPDGWRHSLKRDTLFQKRMYLTIIFLPLLSALVCGSLGRLIGIRGSQFLSCSALMMASVLATIAFYEVGLNDSPTSIPVFNWLDCENIQLGFAFLLDSLSVSMLLPVLWVSTAVHAYSVGYMEGDPHIQRFFSYLSLFTFFMLILVCGENFLLLFIGWEGVGICSYLLINFWFRRLQANKAAIQAILINRIGDFGLSLGIFTMFWLFGNIDYATTFSLAPMTGDDLRLCVCLLLLLAAMAKSAQIGLHTWLPNAMEGPTPVSALIHAATMVTAGVYLLLRVSPILEFCSTALAVIATVGAFTALIAATIGLVQNDLKRVIAYSTCSQLGYMVMSCGLSNYNVALFHLVNHAFFKALLFLSAGAVIHALNSEQDFRKMGGLRYLLPFTYTMMLIGSLSLMALPFLTGFYSKDLILELAKGQYTVTGSMVYWFGIIAALFTSIYSLRLLTLTFFSYPNAPYKTLKSVHEVPFIMGMPLAILALLSIFFGHIARDIFVGIGSSFLGNSLFVHPDHLFLSETEFGLPLIYKFIPFAGSVIAGTIAFLFGQMAPYYGLRLKLSFSRLYTFLQMRWYFDNVYSFILQAGLSFGYITNKVLDRGALEIIGPHGLTKAGEATSVFMKFDSGFIPSYALFMFIGMISLISISFFNLEPSLILLLLWTLLCISFQPR